MGKAVGGVWAGLYEAAAGEPWPIIPVTDCPVVPGTANDDGARTIDGPANGE